MKFKLNSKVSFRKSINQFVLGESSIIDNFSYSALKEKEDYLKIDGRYIRSLFISGYPFLASSGWLDNLVNFGYDCDISYHVKDVDALLALPKLHRKITELESTKRTLLKSGRIIGSEITDPLESAINLRNKILRGQQKLFQISIYVALFAETIQELNKLTLILESSLSAKLFYSKVARYQQLEAIQSILPRATDQLKQLRNLDSSTIALTFPFMSSEYVQPSGILYGINKSNNSLVIVDRFKLQNANSIIFAQSGSGKSYLSKVEILRQLCNQTKVIVIDPENEYQNLADSVNGSYIKISLNSSQRINPFDLLTNKLTKKDLSQHIQDLTSIIDLMVDGLSHQERSAVDSTILNLFSKKRSKAIRLIDFYNELKKKNETRLCMRLEKYITGSLSGLFNSQTNISLDNRLIVFDIKDMADNIRQIMMFIIANFVSNKVQNNKQKQMLVIDEAWMLLENTSSAKFIAGLVRRARKYYLGVSIISQQANDFLTNKYGKIIASQSNLRILMRQDSTTIKNVANEFNLSEFEYNYLLGCDKGDALMLVDQTHVALKITASKKEHPLITTDPTELY